MININRRIVLGSGSPRRKELLEMMGLKFEIVKSDIEEVVEEGLSPAEVVRSLALQKAEDIIKKVSDDTLLITADSIVVCEGKIIGKPKDEQDAYDMLKFLSGKKQYVYTGMIVWDKLKDKRHEIVEESILYMKVLTDLEILDYIKTGESMDKAGGCGIQTRGAVFFERMDGDFYNIVGLSVSKLYDVLKEVES
ncbi:MAG TPA: septum formation protein Maf [Clostridiales bacterium]|nr:MAG: septum formation protein Maf [Clostridiales bacterium GWD2_32_59]HAN09266.1 septum formation protein Maf [Clostridiales bacterium]